MKLLNHMLILNLKNHHTVSIVITPVYIPIVVVGLRICLIDAGI